MTLKEKIGNNLSDNNTLLIACAKHFVGYGAALAMLDIEEIITQLKHMGYDDNNTLLSEAFCWI